MRPLLSCLLILMLSATWRLVQVGAQKEEGGEETCNCRLFNLVEALDPLALEWERESLFLGEDRCGGEDGDGNEEPDWFRQKADDWDETLSNTRIQYRYCAYNVACTAHCRLPSNEEQQCDFRPYQILEDETAFELSCDTRKEEKHINCTDYVTKSLLDRQTTPLFLGNPRTSRVPQSTPPYRKCGGHWTEEPRGTRAICPGELSHTLQTQAAAYADRGTACLSYYDYDKRKCQAECFDLEMEISLEDTFTVALKSDRAWIEYSFLPPGYDTNEEKEAAVLLTTAVPPVTSTAPTPISETAVVPQQQLLESQPCLDPANDPYTATLLEQLSSHPNAHETCETNSCARGCCRAYFWWICDEDNDFFHLPCLCNDNTQDTNDFVFLAEAPSSHQNHNDGNPSNSSSSYSANEQDKETLCCQCVQCSEEVVPPSTLAAISRRNRGGNEAKQWTVAGESNSTNSSSLVVSLATNLVGGASYLQNTTNQTNNTMNNYNGEDGAVPIGDDDTDYFMFANVSAGNNNDDADSYLCCKCEEC